MTTAGGAVQYLRWRKDVADHDYAAASSYLSIRFGESRAQEVSEKLRKLPVIERRANDILRATQRVPLPLSDPGVLRDLQKVLAGEKLSPVLISQGISRTATTASPSPTRLTRTPPCRSSSVKEPPGHLAGAPVSPGPAHSRAVRFALPPERRLGYGFLAIPQ
jgi:hypothetical protein